MRLDRTLDITTLSLVLSLAMFVIITPFIPLLFPPYHPNCPEQRYTPNKHKLISTRIGSIKTSMQYWEVARTLSDDFVTLSADDSNEKEIGAEWVNDYSQNPHDIPNLVHCDEDARGFYNHLGKKGFTKRWIWGDDLAWESDFERPDVGGSDYIWVDAVDYVYFAGHGSEYTFDFGVNHDGDGITTYTVLIYDQEYNPIPPPEAEWGDKDLEWIFIATCKTVCGLYLSFCFSSPISLHGIAGFKTDSYDVPDTGKYLAYYLTDTWGPRCIGDAWKLATKHAQPSDVKGSIVRAVEKEWFWIVRDWYNEYIPGYGETYDDPWKYDDT